MKKGRTDEPIFQSLHIAILKPRQFIRSSKRRRLPRHPPRIENKKHPSADSLDIARRKRGDGQGSSLSLSFSLFPPARERRRMGVSLYPRHLSTSPPPPAPPLVVPTTRLSALPTTATTLRWGDGRARERRGDTAARDRRPSPGAAARGSIAHTSAVLSFSRPREWERNRDPRLPRLAIGPHCPRGRSGDTRPLSRRRHRRSLVRSFAKIFTRALPPPFLSSRMYIATVPRRGGGGGSFRGTYVCWRFTCICRGGRCDGCARRIYPGLRQR